MATVHETVRHSIYNYPGMFTNRTQVLHHLFVVIGNGFEWENGELVDKDPLPNDRTDAEVVHQLDPEMAAAFESIAATSDEARAAVETSLAEMARDGEARLAIRRDADRLADTPGDLNGPVYQPSPNHAYLLNAPKDITLDWHKARVEIAGVVAPLWQSGDYLRAHEEKHHAQVAAMSTLNTGKSLLLWRLALDRLRAPSA